MMIKALSVLLLLMPAPVLTQETEKSPQNPDDRVIEFRINRKTLELVVNRNVNRNVPFSKNMQKASVSGTALVNANVALDFDSGTDTRIPIRIAGQNDVSLSADAGPIVAKVYGQIPFTLDIGLGLDDEHGFYALPSCATANVCISVQCLDAKRRLGRRVIRRVATRVANKKMPEAQASAKREIEERLSSEADKEIQKMIPTINEAFKMDETLAAMGIEQGYGKRQVSKKNDYLQVRVASPGSQRSAPTAVIADAPFEIWIYPSITTDKLTDEISSFWDEVPDELFDMLPQGLDMEAQNPQEQVKLSIENGWTVFRVGDFESLRAQMDAVKTNQLSVSSNR